MQESNTIEVAIIGVITGMLGGVASIPFTLIGQSFLKRYEQDHQHRLNLIEKKRELYLAHKYQMASKPDFEKEISQINIKLASIEGEINRLKAKEA